MQDCFAINDRASINDFVARNDVFGGVEIKKVVFNSPINKFYQWSGSQASLPADTIIEII